MAWPSEAGAIAKVRGIMPRAAPEEQAASEMMFGLLASDVADVWEVNRGVHRVAAKALDATPPPLGSRRFNRRVAKTKWRFDLRGLFRIFNDPEYRVFEGTAPPQEGDTPLATPATLPHTLTAPYTVPETQYWSVSKYNGVLDSGFAPVGSNGETFLRFDVTAQAAFDLAPPQGARSVRLELRPGGVVRVIADYNEPGVLRATEWAITYTTNGADPGTPPAVAPTVTVAMNTTRTAILSYDLPAQGNGTTVKVRLQTRRNDSGTWRYSEGSAVLSVVADAAGPAEPLGGDTWRGRLPE